jgi:hypothetical protein
VGLLDIKFDIRLPAAGGVGGVRIEYYHGDSILGDTDDTEYLFFSEN